MTKKKKAEAEVATPAVPESTPTPEAPAEGTFNLTLQALRQIYEYIRDKDLKGGTGLTVEYKDKHPVFSLETVALDFAKNIMVPEIHKFVEVPIDVTPLTPGKTVGVVFALNFDVDKFTSLIAIDNKLEDLRVILGPELGYAISRGLSDYLLELQGKS